MDVAIAGGGDDLLDSGDTDNLIPSDIPAAGDPPLDPYPITVQDADGNDVPVVTTTGQYRYVGQLVVEFENGVDGQVLPDAPSVSLAIVDFLARGGDQYPFGDATFTNLGVTYQQALANYITDELGGVVTAAAYPEGGESRIVVTDKVPTPLPGPEPESIPEPGLIFGLLGATGLFGARRIKRQA